MQQNINQSETGIGDKKLSVELYVLYPLKTRENLCFSGIFRAYEMGILASNELKGFGRVRHVDHILEVLLSLIYLLSEYLKFWTNSLPFEHQ